MSQMGAQLYRKGISNSKPLIIDDKESTTRYNTIDILRNK